MHHLDDDSIIRYFLGEITENEQLEIDGHASSCNDCLIRLRTMFFLRENFTLIWKKWSAAEHGRIYTSWQNIHTLLETASSIPSMAEQITQCFRAAKEGLIIGTKVFLNKTKRIVSSAPIVLPVGYDFRICIRDSGIGSSEEQVQLEKHLISGSELLSSDDIEQVEKELLKAGSIDTRSPQATVSEIRHEEQLILQIIADGVRGKISLKFWPEVGNKKPAFAMLLSKQALIKPKIMEFKSVEDEEYILAEFENLSDSVYTIRIGPMVS
jgi:hypothetical protein